MNARLLQLLLLSRDSIEFRVYGNSMYPIIKDNDTIKIQKREQYNVGDIIVFGYKNNALLVHRLLKINGDVYFCKGDNAFRLEDIVYDDIVGYVAEDSDNNNTEEFVFASLAMNKIFRKHGYDIALTMKTQEYKLYREKYLERDKNHV